LVDAGIGGANFCPIFDVASSYVINNGMNAGEIEQFFTIIDAGDLRLYELPVRSLTSFIIHVSKYYRHRAAKVFVINLPWSVRQGIKFIWNFLDDFQKSQLGYYGSDYHDDLHALVGKDNLEEKYGGNLPNLKKGEYWPPRLNL